MDLKDFDEQKWQNDKKGCTGHRSEMESDLKAALEQLKGLNADEIIAVLGKPDKNELYKRSQKFFIYHITPAKECTQSPVNEVNTSLRIRFNAMGLAKEVMIYQE